MIFKKRAATLFFLLLGVILPLSLLGMMGVASARPAIGAPMETGAISGAVRAADGASLIGAKVWVEPMGGGPGYGAASDADGHYLIEGLAPGEYRVGAQGDGFMPQFFDHKGRPEEATPVVVAVGQTASGVDFDLAQGGSIAGVVRDASGAPLANANVWADPVNGGPGNGAATDADGAYTIRGLADGAYQVRANADGYVEEFYDNAVRWEAATPVQVQAPQTTPNIDFVLERGGAIAGVVRDGETAEPLAGVDVWADSEGFGAGGAQTEASGAYTITGLAPGDYRVRADRVGYDEQFYNDKREWRLADLVPVQVDQVTSGIDFNMHKERGGVVFGQVALPNSGDPAPWAWVDAESGDFTQHKGEGADEHGQFRIGGLSAGRWQLRAHPPGDPQYREYSESIPIWIDVDETSVITLPEPLLLTPVNLVGRAVMPDGSGAPNAGVHLFSTDYQVDRGGGADPDGYFRFGGLPAGEYRLELQPPWGEMSGVVAPPPVSFHIDGPDIKTDLGDIAFVKAVKHITGRVVRSSTNPGGQASDGDGVPNVEISAHRRGAEGWAMTKTDENGDFNLDVGPGKWEVMIQPAYDDGEVDWVHTSPPKLVTFADDNSEETREMTFTVVTADARIIGRVVGPGGAEVEPWRVWVEVRNDFNGGNGASLKPDGSFSIPVVAGAYDVQIGLDDQFYPTWSGPHLDPVSVAVGDVFDLGTIALVEKNSAVRGRVTRSSDQAGVGGLWVHAWQSEGGWASTRTESDGSYNLYVLPGEWEIDVEAPYTATYVTGEPPQRVSVAENQIVDGIDFVLKEAAGVIEGKLFDPDGNLLGEIDDGWAYAREANSPEPLAGAPVENGRFSLNVPTGDYMVGIWLPPNAEYTVSGEQPIHSRQARAARAVAIGKARTSADVAVINMRDGERTARVGDSTTIPITFTMLPHNATIVGVFYTDISKTVPATGLQGEIFAMGGIGGAWQSAPIDPATGSYRLQVAAGDWNLGYWLDTTDYVNSPPPNTRVTIASGEVFTFNFSLAPTDATIVGRVETPTGGPLNHAWAWAHRERSDASAAIDAGDESRPPDGRFSINVPSGASYEVGAFIPESWGFIQPDMMVVSPTSGSTISVTLRFKESDGKIEGTVYYHDEAGNRVYGPWAWVWAWSDDGQHTGAPTDQQGRFTLNVVTGAVWHVGASYQVEEGSLFYETQAPVDVDMTSDHATVDLDLYLADTALPPSVADTFDPAVGWTHVLNDGTKIDIPAGAMPTTNTVRISITPLVEELQNTLTSRPFGFGYAVTVYDDVTGKQIVNNFNANVLLTFYYSEADLQKRGVSEDDLSPAYFSTTTNSWTKVEKYQVDTVNNQVTVEVNHFSTWGLVHSGKSKSKATPPERIFLPSVTR